MSRSEVDAALDALAEDEVLTDTLLDAVDQVAGVPQGDEERRLAAVLRRARDRRWSDHLQDEAWAPTEADLDALEAAASDGTEDPARMESVLERARQARSAHNTIGAAPDVPKPANRTNYTGWLSGLVLLAAAAMFAVMGTFGPSSDPGYRGAAERASTDAEYLQAVEAAVAQTVLDHGDPGWIEADIQLSAELSASGSLEEWRVESGVPDPDVDEIVDALTDRVQPLLGPPEDSQLVGTRVEVPL